MSDPYYVGGAAPKQLPRSQAAERLERVLSSASAQGEVVDTVKRWNTPLRTEVRAVTALRLADESGKPTVYIPVDVVDGMPKPLADKTNDVEEWQWWLALQLGKLRQSVEGLDLLLKNKNILNNGIKNYFVPSDSISASRDYIFEVSKRSIDNEILQRFKNIEEDVLGAYWIKSSRIQIYWMPIVVFASLMGISVSDLTVTTLCHELVHAYTHRGSDIDGRAWPTDKFIEAGIYITEGIAQFYTEQIMRGLGLRLPSGHDAFCKKRKWQSAPYTDYQDWLEKGKQPTPEAVRLTMLRMRNSLNNKITYEEFRRQLKDSQKQMRGE